MKQKPFTVKLFGWHIYLSHRRLHVVPASTGRGVSRRLRDLRNRRFRRTHGHCEMCGTEADKNSMQMHHILPYCDFPSLGLKDWNLLMLCPRCHYIIHRNPVEQVARMQRVASGRGINLSLAFNMSAANRWAQIQAQKGGAQ